MHGSRRRYIQAAQNIEQRTLAAAGRPKQHNELTCEKFKVHASQRVHLDLAHVINLRDAARREYDRRLNVRNLGRRWFGRNGAHAATSTACESMRVISIIL